MSLEFARLNGSMAPICDIFHILIKRLGDFFGSSLTYGDVLWA